MHKKQRGGRAEQIAADRLIAKGLRITDRNRTMRGGELDIVGYIDDIAVIVEVRSIDFIDDVHEYMSRTKYAHLVHTTESWIHAHHWTGPVRIDVVYVKGDTVVNRFQNITNT